MWCVASIVIVREWASPLNYEWCTRRGKVSAGLRCSDTSRYTRKGAAHQYASYRSKAYSVVLAELAETDQIYLEGVIVWLATEATSRDFGNLNDAMRFASFTRGVFTEEQRVRIPQLLSLNSDHDSHR